MISYDGKFFFYLPSTHPTKDAGDLGLLIERENFGLSERG